MKAAVFISFIFIGFLAFVQIIERGTNSRSKSIISINLFFRRLNLVSSVFGMTLVIYSVLIPTQGYSQLAEHESIQGKHIFQKAPYKKIKKIRSYLKTDSCEYLIEEKLYDRSGYLSKRDSFAIFHGQRLHFEQETFRYYGINRDSIVYNSNQEDEQKVIYCETTLKLNNKGQVVSKSGNKRYYKNTNSSPYNDSYFVSFFQYNDHGHLSQVVSQDQNSPMSKKDLLLSLKDTTIYFNAYDTIGFDHYQYTKYKSSGRGYNYNNQGLVDSVTQIKVYRHIPNKDAVIVFDSTEFVTAYMYQNGKIVSIRTEYKNPEMASKQQKWFKRHLILSEITNEINIEETEYVLKDEYLTSKTIYHEQIILDKKKRVSSRKITVLRNGNPIQNELIVKYKKYWF